MYLRLSLLTNQTLYITTLTHDKTIIENVKIKTKVQKQDGCSGRTSRSQKRRGI